MNAVRRSLLVAAVLVARGAGRGLRLPVQTNSWRLVHFKVPVGVLRLR